MHRPTHLLLAVLLLVLLNGCLWVRSAPENGQPTLEAAARQTVSCDDPPDKAMTFSVRARYPWRQGWIVIYETFCPPGTRFDGGGHGMRGIGQTFVEQINGLWYAHTSTGVGRRADAPPDGAIEFDAQRASGSDPTSNYSIVYGKALQPAVARIQTTFADGRVQEARPVAEIFAIIVPGSVQTCLVRSFAADGTLLDQHDLQPLAPCGTE